MSKYLGVILATTLLASAAVAQPAMIPEWETGDVVGTKAPSVDLKTLDGKTTSVAALQGKVVVLNFWASWCGPCRYEMPELEKMYQELKSKGIVVLAVNLDRESDLARNWLATMKVTFPVALDPDSKMAGMYAVASMPTTFLIDRKGVVQAKTVGYRAEELEALKAKAAGL